MGATAQTRRTTMAILRSRWQCLHWSPVKPLTLWENTMNINLSIGPLIALIAGILILTVPRMLNYIVAIYLIVIGLLGLFGSGNLHFN
jgi:hypothetical protein